MSQDTPDLPLTPDDVAQILALLGDGKQDELDLTTPRYRLRLTRGPRGDWTQDWQTRGAAGLTVAVAAAATSVAVVVEEGVHAVMPPLPGTFYRSPQPGAPPFVSVGDRVEPNTVVCIIETMKLMTSVHAGMSGVVVAIDAENGQLIDKDAVLLRIRPEG
jgi:acetyl-CoA carboxylase biotin carboxyl carrier protein